MGDQRATRPEAATTIDAFDCPCCGLRVNVARTSGGDMLLHAMPPCESFVKLDERAYRSLVEKARRDHG